MFNSTDICHRLVSPIKAAGCAWVFAGEKAIQCKLVEKSAVFLMGAWCLTALDVYRFFRSGIRRKMGDWTV
jgi:hypothetical protein